MRAARVLFLLLLSPAVALAQQPQSPSSAEYCGDCHRAIQEGWKQSAHAAAMESRLFQDALKMTDADFGSPARKVCLGCHSPIAVQLGDFALIRKVSWEGVTCDYCHSIREVTNSGTNFKARVEFSDVKSGPYKEVESPAHRVVYSEVHTTSLACASCHEYRNPLGFPVLTTYTEWKASPYAQEGRQCQSCHMFTVEGKVVDPRVKEIAQKSINLHQMPGSRSVEQLNRAIRTQLSAVHEGDKLKVNVSLTNAGAGHYVPTGSPLRQLILELRVEPYGGARPYREERVYRRSVVDQKNSALQREHLCFLRGAKAVKDTRIAPRETRVETFTFDLPKGRQARVDASLYYFYSPMASTEAQQKIKILSLARHIQ
jgi:hypothetical protein